MLQDNVCGEINAKSNYSRGNDIFYITCSVRHLHVGYINGQSFIFFTWYSLSPFTLYVRRAFSRSCCAVWLLWSVSYTVIYLILSFLRFYSFLLFLAIYRYARWTSECLSFSLRSFDLYDFLLFVSFRFPFSFLLRK